MITSKRISLFLLLAVFTCAAAVVSGDDFHHCVKCGTPAILELIENGAGKAALRARPDRHTFARSAGGHFLVHYDSTGWHAPSPEDLNKNGIPDFVDSALVYLEYAWDIQVEELGYDRPLSDEGAGGGNEVDFYIKNYDKGGYGATYPEGIQNGSVAAWCMIDNDFAEDQYATHGYEALKVTTAHEFFHTIHFGYNSSSRGRWWMEQSAVWMEDRIWTGVNDYLAYLKYYFGDGIKTQYYKTYPLNSSLGNFMYGATIWAHYLVERFGDDIIKYTWEAFREKQYPGIQDFEGVIMQASSGEMGLSGALGEFAAWNYFTADRANTIDFYPESLFPELATFPEDHVEVAFSKFRENDGVRFAGEVSVNSREGKGSFIIRNKTMVFNRKIPDPVFILKKPPMFEIVDLIGNR